MALKFQSSYNSNDKSGISFMNEMLLEGFSRFWMGPKGEYKKIE